MDSPAPFKLINEGDARNGLFKGIVYNGWTITSKKAPICNSVEMDNIQKNFGIPPPEMVFGNNHVTIKKGETEYIWNAYDALSLIDTSSNSNECIRVAYAKEWTQKSTANHTDIKNIIKPYDWTYSTVYKGTLVSSKDGRTFEAAEDPYVDIQLLMKPDPIYLYDETILYEDELADNGTAILSIRLRVMPLCFLVLQRFFLRVDDVLFRIRDTRLYHEFGSKYLVREYTSKEDHFNNIRKRLPVGKTDLSLLNDPNWVSQMLPKELTMFCRERLLIDA
ncbi:TIP41-like family-domain-containing protein [Spinellus fusiger]|nr:TIP41-like family-domain-containing protein [Spinellus fusiger]